MRAEVAFLDSLQGGGIRPGLSRMRRLLAALAHPERSYRTLIVAGTNGKGSTSATLASIVAAAGYRTGLYTSPHLVTLLERWKVDGQNVPPAGFRRAVRELQAIVRATGIVPTYFEALTLAGFLIFRDAGCDVVVLEVGMGGRLDATNVTQPVVAAISSVSFDHTEYLGNTLGQIATEKAGVIPERGVAVTSNASREVVAAIRRRAREVDAQLHLTSVECNAREVRERDRLRFELDTPVGTYTLRSPLIGMHQLDNVTLAVRAAELGMPALPRINRRAIEQGVRLTDWRGRLERATVGGKRWLIDGAHNPGGIERLVEFLERSHARRRTLVFAAMRDKDVAAIAAALFSLFDDIVFTQADAQRGMPPPALQQIAAPLARARLHTAAMPRRAFAKALSLEPREIVVAGSLYLAGAAVEFIDRCATK